jgi:hypothetical protein
MVFVRQEKDVMWMYEKLMVGATEEQAAEHFREVGFSQSIMYTFIICSTFYRC